MEKVSLTVVIIARDEAENLRHLLPHLTWASRVIVVGNHCQDETAQVARENGAEYLENGAESFAKMRESVLEKIETEWVFYLDADERVTRDLAEEIAQKLAHSAGVAAYRLRRENYHYGVKMTGGGWQNDTVVRLLRRSTLRGWDGEIHESPVFEGETQTLNAPLLHFTHRGTAANLAKSSRWTIKEARLLAAARQTPVRPSTILRKVIMEFYRRFWQQRGYRDGMAGFVEALVQACNRGFVYIQVWECMQKPSIEQRYEKLEESLN